MENAARAILMAAGVLIAIVLLSFFVFLFRRTGESTADIYSTLSESEITEFNQQFLNYDWNVTGGKELSVQDVATLINLAIDNNKTQKLPTEITVYIGVTKIVDMDTEEGYYLTWLNANIDSGNLYMCRVAIKNKLVYRIYLFE